MKIVNLTPHVVTYRSADGTDTHYPSAGLARLDSVCTPAPCPIPGHTAQRTELGAVTGLPDPDGETVYIVSTMMLGSLAGRTDVVAPATGPRDGAIREDGRIIAVTKWNVP